MVFYADPMSSASFGSMFRFLYALANPPQPNTSARKQLSKPAGPRIRLALRWRSPAVSNESRPLVLSGYGAALDIKKSEYLAIDDRASAASTAVETKSSEQQHSRPEMLPVRKRDISSKTQSDRLVFSVRTELSFDPDVLALSLRTAAAILNSSAPLDTFVDLTSSFPLIASQLSTLMPEVPEQLEVEINYFRSGSALSVRPSFHLNGIPLAESSVDPFALLRLMRQERRYVTGLTSLHNRMTGKQARSMLSHEGLTAGATGGASGRGRESKVTAEMLGDLFDASDRQEGGGLVFWWNDLEKDKKYKTWSKDLKDVRCGPAQITSRR